MTETRDECMNRVIMVAAYHGYFDVLKTYWSDVPEDKMPLLMDARTCIWVARGGHLETLQWLRSQGCPWDKYMCSVAAAYGHLKCLQWARENGYPWIANHRFFNLVGSLIAPERREALKVLVHHVDICYLLL